MMRLRASLPVLLFAGFAVFIALVIWAANTGRGERYWSFLGSIPFGDKLGHVILMGTLCFLLNLALRCKTVGVRRIRMLLGTLLVAAFVVIEEFSQVFLPNRSFDIGDLFADTVGLLLASRLAWLIAGRKTAAVAVTQLKHPDTRSTDSP